MRINGLEAARAFIAERYPDCLAALLFGSVARGEATDTSDLDILIVASEDISPFRKSYREYGWSIEVFAGSRRYYEDRINQFRKIHIPSFLTSYAEGVILKDY